MQGQRLTDWQVETIRLAYAESGNVAHAGREAGCAYNTAKGYIKSHQSELTELRNQKKADVIAQVAAVRIRLLEEMMTPSRLTKASIYELGTLFGILTDKHQLLTGQATARNENRSIDPDVLTPEEKQQAAALRTKLLGEVSAS